MCTHCWAREDSARWSDSRYLYSGIRVDRRCSFRSHRTVYSVTRVQVRKLYLAATVGKHLGGWWTGNWCTLNQQVYFLLFLYFYFYAMHFDCTAWQTEGLERCKQIWQFQCWLIIWHGISSVSQVTKYLKVRTLWWDRYAHFIRLHQVDEIHWGPNFRSDSMQSLPNYFGHILIITTQVWRGSVLSLSTCVSSLTLLKFLTWNLHVFYADTLSCSNI